VSVLAPTGTIGLVMDCDTTGVEPDFAIVKFKKLAGGGYFKIVNQSVPKALEFLGYTHEQIEDIEKYIKGHGTLRGLSRHQPRLADGQGLHRRGHREIRKAARHGVRTAHGIQQMGARRAFCKRLGFSEEQLADPAFDMLRSLGFHGRADRRANEYVCGTMMIEGAPHVKKTTCRCSTPRTNAASAASASSPSKDTSA
jgi:ribonucleoside-diphosphate reductase alpha chain